MGTSTYELRCRECGKTLGNQPRSICEDCFSPLEITYDYDSLRTRVSRELFASRAPNIWRYRELLPLPAGLSALPPGWIHAAGQRAATGREDRLAAALR